MFEHKYPGSKLEDTIVLTQKLALVLDSKIRILRSFPQPGDIQLTLTQECQHSLLVFIGLAAQWRDERNRSKGRKLKTRLAVQLRKKAQDALQVFNALSNLLV